MSSTSRIMEGSFDVAGGGGGGEDFETASVAVARHLIVETACREHWVSLEDERSAFRQRLAMLQIL